MLRKSIRKIGALMLVLAMVCSFIPVHAQYVEPWSVWDGSVNTNWLADNGITDDSQITSSTKLHITSAADFIAFRNKVVEGTTSQAWGGGPYYPLYKAEVILDCNIDLNNLNLKYGIGGWSKGDQFAGIFNGNGFVIKNVRINPNLADAALVQPAANAHINAASYATNGTLTGESSPYMMGLFPFLQYINGVYPSIKNANIENVEYTLPNTMITTEGTHFVGGLVGWQYNGSQISACSVKNMKVVGGPSNYVNGKQYYIGGLVGASQQGNYIVNSYVNGLDITGVTIPNLAWTWLSGLFNFYGTAIKTQNVYSANIKYNPSTIYNFDSFAFPLNSGTLTATHESGGTYNSYGAKYSYFYSDNPKRLTNQTEVSQTYNDGLTVKQLTNNLNTATDWGTSQGGRNHMINMYSFDGGYARTGAERFISGHNPRFTLANGTEVSTIAEASGAPVRVTFDTINTTWANQTTNLILTSYKNGNLVDAKVDYVTVAKQSVGDCTTSGYQYGYYVGNVVKDSNNQYTIYSTDTRYADPATKITSASTIDTEDCDEVKAFMWNSLNDLEALSFAATLPADTPEEVGPKNNINVLVIGNSFSVDGTHYLKDIATAAGVNINKVAVVQHGGSRLHEHWEYRELDNNSNPYFSYQCTGQSGVSGVNLKYALEQADWDYVFLQEWRPDAGTYEQVWAPYIFNLATYVKQYCPNAKLGFQMTWAFELGKQMNGYYDGTRNDDPNISGIGQKQMWANSYAYNRLAAKNLGAYVYDGSNTVADNGLAVKVIPTGYAIQYARSIEESGVKTFDTTWDDSKYSAAAHTFDTLREGDANAKLVVNAEDLLSTADTGKIRLHRDGFHMSQAGRYLDACVWFEALTGQSCVGNTFIPGAIDLDSDVSGTTYRTSESGTQWVHYSGLDAATCAKLQNVAHTAVQMYYNNTVIE